MADTSTPITPPAAQAQVPPVVPTAGAASHPAGAPPSLVAGPEGLTIDELMDQMAAPQGPPEKAASGTVAKKDANTTPADGAGKPAAGDAAGDTVAAAADEDPEAADEQEHEQDLEKLKDTKATPDWVGKRLSKLQEQKRDLRGQISAKDAELAEAREQLTKVSDLVQKPAASSALGEFDTLEKLYEKHATVASYLEWADSPEGKAAIEGDASGAAEARVDQSRAYALKFLKHFPAQEKTLKNNASASEAVRKAHPEMFDGKSAESLHRLEMYSTDPRSRADFDQILADALYGRKMKATAKAAGEKAAATKAKAAAGVVPGKPATPPVPTAAATRSPVLPGDGASAKEQALSKAKTKEGVSVDEMMDAGVF